MACDTLGRHPYFSRSLRLRTTMTNGIVDSAKHENGRTPPRGPASAVRTSFATVSVEIVDDRRPHQMMVEYSIGE